MKTCEKEGKARDAFVRGAIKTLVFPLRIVYTGCEATRYGLDLADTAVATVQLGTYEAINKANEKADGEALYYNKDLEGLKQNYKMAYSEMLKKIYGDSKKEIEAV